MSTTTTITTKNDIAADRIEKIARTLVQLAIRELDEDIRLLHGVDDAYAAPDGAVLLDELDELGILDQALAARVAELRNRA